MRELALFAGGGGGILGGQLLGWTPVCAVENDSAARDVLLARQLDGSLGRFPIWDDARTFDGKPWRGHVDVITGGFPCQDISDAGKKEGIKGERSSLWVEMCRIIHEVQPAWVLVENAEGLVRRGLRALLWDLAEIGFDAEWGVLGASKVGAPHRRNRLWLVAKNTHPDRGHHSPYGNGAGSTQERVGPVDGKERSPEHPGDSSGGLGGMAWSVEPGVGRVVDGLASRLDEDKRRVKLIGNGQVPQCMAAAWLALKERFEDEGM